MCMIRQVIIRGTQVRFGNSVLGSKMLGGVGGGGAAEGVLVDPSNPSLGA